MTNSATPSRVRAESIQRLRSEPFDLLVIGGGINGAGIARDAAMRGMRVALVEKGDFASGTSSKSSKLVHGGVRYLQHGNIRLVRAACRERDLLRRRLAPHLVQPLPFLFPVYRGDPVGLFTLGLGMWLYDALAAFRNIRAHRMLGAKRLLEIEPGLRPERLRGAALYYDCLTDDARLTLETILAAVAEGAVILNYVELKTFLKENGHITGACLQDRFSQSTFELRTRQVVNATGPWADQIRRLDDPAAKPSLRLTKGVHIVVRRERIGNEYAVVLHSPQDKRVLFIIPWGRHDLIGTTDTDFEGSPDQVVPDQGDYAYLLEAANWFFPRARLTPADVVGAYAGLRPLVASDEANPSAVPREESISESPAGLITLAGGKLTTYRLVAEKIVDLVLKRAGLPVRQHRHAHLTALKPLPGGERSPEQMIEELASRDGHGLTNEQIQHLVRRYGSRTRDVLALIEKSSELNSVLAAGLLDLWAEAAYAVQAEMALRAEDILLRRTTVGIRVPQEAKQIANLLKQRFDIN